MTRNVAGPRWTVIVPVKPFDRAKSRLALEPDRRARLARRFTDHVLGELRRIPAVETVVVVGIAHPAADIGLADPGTMAAAVDRGRSWAAAHRAEYPIAVIPADLPALTAATLGAALDAASGHRRAFMPDRSGEGTTLLTSSSPAELAASYGPGSADAHRLLGLVEITGDWPGLRDDVDTLADLERVARQGPTQEIGRLIAS
ncbi:2-phospho-L-lactate guanylyltransferase [Aeromicrobium sp. PE09-221]|uniref:2-phospho-L-lactate guanylyltransferase n=1 Tax=Aeromicrobium sp. PE09-221 TaxID=1898043 RepID=UPI000B3EDAFC|nr:2-phospho-L-lactate guanylyltransferase [Aeromicrobium sp. PE09-221]OUZ10105.1 2-phospho-L-lactate guanylyltransferase [Aeromicrobium sp. PE09-221]